jgi:hypothetical protein
MGECDFNDPDGGTFRMRVVEVERRTKGEITCLGASKLLTEDGWTAEKIADLYFDRWPNQEANFRAVNQATKSKDVKGYGKQLVDNVSVVTELDKLAGQVRRLQERMQKTYKEQKDTTSKLKDETRELRRQERRYETVSRHVEAQMKEGQQITASLQAKSEEQQSLVKQISKQKGKVEKLENKKDSLTDKLSKSQDKLDSYLTKSEELESRRRIFRHDVELDSIFSLLKVGLVLLVTYVLKEHLGDARMEPVTFLERMATLPARLRKTPELEILTFYYNYRDPDVMAILAENCETINSRKVRMRSGRVLRIQVDPAPPPKRPPPKNRRTKPGDRFKRN